MNHTIEGIPVTEHARVRMAQRGIAPEAVLAVLDHGRRVHTRGARFFVIGRREVDRARRAGVDLSAHEGLHVLLAPDGSIITVYRNKNLVTRPHDRRRRSRTRRVN